MYAISSLIDRRSGLNKYYTEHTNCANIPLAQKIFSNTANVSQGVYLNDEHTNEFENNIFE